MLNTWGESSPLSEQYIGCKKKKTKKANIIDARIKGFTILEKGSSN